MTKNRSAKPSTRLVAAVAGNHSGDPFEERTFGEFNGLEFNQTPATFALVASRYAYVGSPLCLHLWVHDNGETPMWEPYLELTKNVRPYDCTDDEIIVKTDEENAHMRVPLLALGIFADTGKRVETGYTLFEVWSITPLFMEQFNTRLQVLESV